MTTGTKNRKPGRGRGPSSIGPRCVVAVVHSEAEANREIARTFRARALGSLGVEIPRGRIRVGDVPMSPLQVERSIDIIRRHGGEGSMDEPGCFSIAFAYHDGKLYVADAVGHLDDAQANYFWNRFVEPELRHRGVFSRRPEELRRDFGFVVVSYRDAGFRVFTLDEAEVL